MSIAFGPHKGRTTHVLAGVNSGPDAVAKGVNEHLRILGVEPQRSPSSTRASEKKSSTSPSPSKGTAKISELSRTSLFAHPDDPDSYQRVLRVVGGMGAASTAMGRKAQLVVFKADGAKPTVKKLVELPREVEDLDIVQTGPESFQVVFCYKYELHVLNVGGDEEESEPKLVFTMPEDQAQRPAFRSLRYLGPHFVLAASNLPGRKGVVLHALRLPSERNTETRLAASAKISRAISATAMAVTNLTPPADALAPLGETQFMVAVAGNDSSLSLYTLEHRTSDDLTLLADLYPMHTVRETHGGGNITALAFSTFATPKTHLRPQYIKLASASLQRSVAVHSIPLRRLPDRPASAANAGSKKTTTPPPVRYVAAIKSKGGAPQKLLTIVAVAVVVMAVIYQTIMEMMGETPPVLHVHKLLPGWYEVPYRARAWGAQSSAASSAASSVGSDDEFLLKLLNGQTVVEGGRAVVSHAEKAAEQAQEQVEGQVKKIRVDVEGPEVRSESEASSWDELSDEAKEGWRQALVEAGIWTREMGDDVLRQLGVGFGQ